VGFLHLRRVTMTSLTNILGAATAGSKSEWSGMKFLMYQGIVEE